MGRKKKRGPGRPRKSKKVVGPIYEADGGDYIKVDLDYSNVKFFEHERKYFHIKKNYIEFVISSLISYYLIGVAVYLLYTHPVLNDPHPNSFIYFSSLLIVAVLAGSIILFPKYLYEYFIKNED